MRCPWTRRVRGLSGSRWSVYQSQVKNRMEITWMQFKDEVVKHNPELAKDGWIFRPHKVYRLPAPPLQPTAAPREAKLIPGVPYFSQMDNPHTGGRYWASDPDRKDETPDGCWMNKLPGGGSFGKEADGCPGPMEKGCIRPGSCNVTALYMLLKFRKLTRKPVSYPDDSRLSPWLQDQLLSPTWLYVYMMDYWGRGEQLWDGVHPTSAYNSLVCARGDFLREVILRCGAAFGVSLTVPYTTSVTFTEYQRAIDDDCPVIISSRAMRHVVLGIGYAYENGVPQLIAHDPYGKKRRDLKKWELYNGCGDHARHGQQVRYPFEKTAGSYLLYCLPD